MCRERAAPPFYSCCPLVAPGLQSQCSRWVNVMCSVGCQLSHPLSLWERGKGDEINAELVCCINAPLTQQTTVTWYIHYMYVYTYIYVKLILVEVVLQPVTQTQDSHLMVGWQMQWDADSAVGTDSSVSTSLPCPKALLLMVPPLDL